METDPREIKRAKDTKGALRFLLARLRKHVGTLIALCILTSVTAVLSVSLAIFMARTIDSAAEGDTRHMFIYLGVMLGVTLVMLFLRFYTQFMQSRMGFRMDMSLRRSLLSKIMTREYTAVSGYHSGDLMTRLTGDTGVVSSAASTMLPSICQMAARLGFAFGLLTSFDWIFAAAAVAASIVVAVVSLIARPLIKKLHRRMQEAEGRTRSFMQESIDNQLVVRVFDRDGRMIKKSDELQEATFRAYMKRRTVGILAGQGISFIFTLGTMLALAWGALGISGVLGKAISFGTLTAVIQLVGQVQAPFAGLTGILPQFFTMTASCERLMEIEALPPEFGSDGKEEPKEFRSARFDGVSFAYRKDGSPVPVLRGASFEINRGDFTAITGISGIGKSTLMKLVLGVLRPDGGEIDVNTELGTLPASAKTRRLFAYVPQGNMLLSGTVRENIAFWSENASDEEIMRAARIACADGFISELPNGLDTSIGEHGHGLSEGQAQRLAVARAILTGAPVLLLDEATSALDAGTEKQLLENLRGSGIETVIIITHKTAALEVCTKSLRIENGKVITDDLRPM